MSDQPKKRRTNSDMLEFARLNIEERLIARAAGDAAFRQALSSDPKKAIEEETGLELGANVKVSVHEEVPCHLHLVLPIPISDVHELNNELLEQIAGGSAKAWVVAVSRSSSPPYTTSMSGK